MNALDIAAARAERAADPESFLLAFHAGLAAAGSDVDTARFLASLIADGHASSAAGWIEGLAAANAEAGMRSTPDDPYWRYRAPRIARKAVTA